MASQKKSWNDKLRDSKDLPKTEKIPSRMQKRLGKGTMVIPAPREVDAIMKKVPPGKTITINGIREKLARKHHTDTACPITTGIFAWVAAHAAAENEAQGKEKITAWWRTLKEGGTLNEKYPGGTIRQAKELRKEGHRILRKGQKWMLADAKKKRAPK